jgi:hypothetical protein
MFLQQEIYPTNDRSVPPQVGDVELLEGARLSKQIAAPAQVSSWHKAAFAATQQIGSQTEVSGHARALSSC